MKSLGLTAWGARLVSDHIETKPEFETRISIERWLRDESRAVTMAISSRMLLRQLPKLAHLDRKSANYTLLAYGIFQAAALARASVLYPEQAGRFRSSAKALTELADKIRLSDYLESDTERLEFRLQSDTERLEFGLRYVFWRTSGAVASARVGAAQSASLAASWDFTGVTFDAQLIASGMSAGDLVRTEIQAVGLGDLWPRLKAQLPPNQDWEVWTRWYEDCCSGITHPEDWEIVFASVPVAEWRRGPAAANRWIKEHLPTEPGGPSVPAPVPATLEPVLIGEIVTLSTTPPSAHLAEAEIAAALAALKARFERLLSEIEGIGNIDPRFPAILRDFVSRLPTCIPNLATLYDVGHELAALRAYEATVIAEWPGALSPRYSAAVLALDLTLQKFPKWKAFAVTRVTHISPEQAEQISQFSKIVASTMRLDGPRDHIEEVVPQTLEALTNFGERIGGAIVPMAEAGRADVARDELESINNLLKIEASVLPEDSISAKIVSALRDEIKAAGGDLKKGAIEAKSKTFSAVGGALVYGPVALLVLLAANTSGIPVFPWLLKSFPTQFGWLEPFLRSLKLL